MEADKEEILPQRRSLTNFLRLQHNANLRKAAQKYCNFSLDLNDIPVPVRKGPPRQNGLSSFTNLVTSRGGTPATPPIRNLASPQRETRLEWVGNLSHRLSQVQLPIFSPFLPEEVKKEATTPIPIETSEALANEFEEIFNRNKKPESLLSSNQNQAKDSQNSKQNWIRVKQNQSSAVAPIKPKKVLTLQATDSKASILDKALAPKVTDYVKMNNRTRSRRARSKMTYTTQEKNRCKVILTKDKYYCKPDIRELDARMDDDGHCYVENFEIGHLEWGKIVFDGLMDVAGINLDTSSKINRKNF